LEEAKDLLKKRSVPPDWINLSPKDFVKKWYDDYYSQCVYCNAAGVGQKFMHRSIERRHNSDIHFDRVLEIGGNRGEHLQFIRHSFNEYCLTDIADTSKKLLAKGQPIGLQFKVEDACSLSFEDEFFDRVLCSCVLHHVENAESALCELRRVLKPGGKADIFLSCDPGFAFRLGRYLGPVREAKKLGLDDVKRLLDARDHRNHVAGLTRLIRYVFRNDAFAEKSYPLPHLSWNFSFWKVFEITKQIESQ